MEQKLRTLPHLRDVNSDLQNRGLQAQLVMDRDTASRLGITQPLITRSTMRLGSGKCRPCISGINQYHVVMEVDPKFQQTPKASRIFMSSPPMAGGSSQRLHALCANPRLSALLTRDSFPPSLFPLIWRPVFPRVRPWRRSGCRSARSAYPAAIHAWISGHRASLSGFFPRSR